MPLQIAVSQPNGSVTEHVLFEGRQYRIGRAHSADTVSYTHLTLPTNREV